MDIRKISYNMSLSAILLVFCSCAENQQLEQKDKMPLRLEAVSLPVQTRTISSTEIQNTLFITGQLIKTYSTITGATDGTTTWGNPLLLKAENNDNGVNPLETTDETTLYFPPGDDVNATINAVYPSTVNCDGDVKSFTVLNPQAGDDDYMASDLMFASVTTPKTDQTVNLQFAHKMAKLVVNATGIDGLTINAIRLKNICQTVGFDTSTSPWSLTSSLTNSSDLTIASNGPDVYTTTLTGAGLFPPQTLGTGDNIEFMEVDVRTSDGTGTAYFIVATKAFEGGRVYTINVKIGPKNLQTGDAGTVIIAPWPESVGTVNIQAVGNLGLRINSLADDGDSSTNTMSEGSYTYNGKVCRPIPTVDDGKESDATPLTSSDYNVAYYNDLNAGTAIIVVTGKGEYEGLSTFTTYNIKKAANTMSYPNNNAAFNTNLSKNAKVQNELVKPSFQTNEVYGQMTYGLYSDAACTTAYTGDIATIDANGNVSMQKKGGPIYVKASMDDSGNFEAAPPGHPPFVAIMSSLSSVNDLDAEEQCDWPPPPQNTYHVFVPALKLFFAITKPPCAPIPESLPPAAPTKAIARVAGCVNVISHSCGPLLLTD